MGGRIYEYDVLNWLANGVFKVDFIKDYREIRQQMMLAYLAVTTNLRFAS